MPLIAAVPPNTPGTVTLDRKHHSLEWAYNQRVFFQATYSGATQVEVVPGSDPEKVVQTVFFHGTGVRVTGTYNGSSQTFAAETDGPQQTRFPLVRNSDGPSHNLRNNAIYDRQEDTVLVGPPNGETLIAPKKGGSFEVTVSGNEVRLVFKPRFYQKHKNIPYFQPWLHPLTERPIMGWCSWWAYRTDIDEKTMVAVARVFDKKLKPFGYDIIQLDDGYESGEGAPPDFWLKTNSKFPTGLPGLAKKIRKAGMEPGIWVGTQIFNEAFANAHPKWFVRDPDGEPHKGPWIGYGVDGSNKTALRKMYGPIWDEMRNADFSYVKIDSLRHLLYDSLYPCRAQMNAEGVKPEDAFRDYLAYARQQLGSETYILACWGVLPEAAGIVDACRLGGDGFGPSTMQQYNSWNNVVWRNDPDHVDLQGEGDEILRPTLVSMAGAQLLLSDKSEFYEDDTHLEGAKRASPVPFTRPGQLYDFDSSKTDHLVQGLRNQNGGSESGPIDASQHGNECPWWQLDVSRPYENWTVLGRLSWSAQPEQDIKFADLGLPNGRYAVYEFWTKRYLGEFEDAFPAEAQKAKHAHVYCIRKVLDHPQVISTNRHISQGGPDLEETRWEKRSKTLSGSSILTRNDPYEIRVRMGGRKFSRSDRPVLVEGDLAILKWNSAKGGKSDWWIQFR